MIRRPPRSTRTDTLSLHDALPIYVQEVFELAGGQDRELDGRLVAEHRGRALPLTDLARWVGRSEEHTSELQSLMRISYAVFCLKKKKKKYKQSKNDTTST